MERSTSALWQWSPSATRQLDELHRIARSGPLRPRWSPRIWRVVGHQAGRFFIVLAPGLDQWSEAHTLTHELIHVERGLGFKEAERKDEEATVRRLTRCRMAFYDGRLHESVPAVGR
ncbi:MAG: hypothetical protein ACR2MB_00335 [Acidimicrobiales bacterium]